MANHNTFQKEMEKHLVAFKSNRQYLPPTNNKKWLYHDMADNLFPPIKHGFLQYVYDSGMPLHDFVNHVRSSQMFCINLFYHLIKNEPENLLKILGDASSTRLIKLLSFEFEFSAEDNYLGEWKSDLNRPEEYVTATDLFIKAKDDANNTVGYLIEVKFSENDFTNCGGYSSKGNTHENKMACEDGMILLNDYNSCYLQGVHGKSRLKRNYLNYFDKTDFNHSSFSGKCPFIKNHQCIRNHSLLKALIDKQKIDRGFFVLVYHDQNADLIKEWTDYEAILANSAKSEILSINAGRFINESGEENYKNYFRDRYLI